MCTTFKTAGSIFSPPKTKAGRYETTAIKKSGNFAVHDQFLSSPNNFTCTFLHHPPQATPYDSLEVCGMHPSFIRLLTLRSRLLFTKKKCIKLCGVRWGLTGQPLLRKKGIWPQVLVEVSGFHCLVGWL